MGNFVHLHTHSHYSLLDGLARIDDLVNEAVKYGMPACALTDHGNMYGAIEFYKKCRAAGIKPILGVEAYMAHESLYQKRANVDSKRYHVILLAKNLAGYKNLLKLITVSNLDGYYYKPRIDKDILRQHKEGLIGMSACQSGEIPRAIQNNDFEKAERLAKEYEEIFGKGNFYIEIMHHPNLEGFEVLQEKLKELAKKTGIPLVATQDIHYIKKEDAKAQDMLIAVGRKETVNNLSRENNVNEDFSFRSSEEMERLFSKYPEAISNTLKIAGDCDLELELGKWVFPKIKLPQNVTAEEELKKITLAGLEKKFNHDKDNIQKLTERMEYELKVINDKGYAPYFLVVADIINFARNKKIAVNTRGSAAGSFVSYLIGITSVDPVKFMLPFERFLNPYRPSPPDIDMDFADDKRDEIIEYIKQIYGVDYVAQIGTFGTMMARGAVRDVNRAMGKPYFFGDQIAKLIPFGLQGFPMTISRALKETPELEKMYNENIEAKEVIDMAKQIEGCARHISVHAAGLVISPNPLTEYAPLQREPNGEKIITQYDMHAIEDTGLLKMDLLGIKNLATLGNSIKLVKKIHNIDIDLEKIPYNDKKVFEMLSRGETTGVFQLGGNGMTKWLKELKPTKLTDIMAMIALFRPGPMDNIPTYIQRKNGKEPIIYLDLRLKKILDDTYGVITYQDDLLYIAIEIAGYDWNTVDKFRKAVGKKIPEEMAKQELIFIEGCQKYGGLSKQKAEALWKLFDPFKGYGFNKAHAASYSQVAYQTAYMKANFPAEFMTALLTGDSGDTEKIAAAINECKRMNIPVLPPDINASFGDFTVVKGTLAEGLTAEAKSIQTYGAQNDQIRFGLFTIKNLGTEIAEAVIKEREARGSYKNFSDFLDRVEHKNLNKKSLEALIKSGSFDAFNERNMLLFNLEKSLDYNKEIKNAAQKNQTSLFSLVNDKSSLPSLKLAPAAPVAFDEKLKWEKEFLGLYVSGHPLQNYEKKLAKVKMNISQIKEFADGTPIIVAGLIGEIKKIMTKNNEPMLFIKIQDLTGEIEAVVFPRVLESRGKFIKEDACVSVKGRVSLRNNNANIIVSDVKEV